MCMEWFGSFHLFNFGWSAGFLNVDRTVVNLIDIMIYLLFVNNTIKLRSFDNSHQIFLSIVQFLFLFFYFYSNTHGSNLFDILNAFSVIHCHASHASRHFSVINLINLPICHDVNSVSNYYFSVQFRDEKI